jgi:putative redox protein
MITTETIYLTTLRTEVTHVKSGVTIITDAPVDNKGKGESFSPTDLLASSLASCMLTIVGILAENQGFIIDGTTASTTKIMATAPRRVIEIKVDFQFPEIEYSEKQKLMIERAALTCPVALSLHPDIKQTIAFNFYQKA